MGYLLAAISVSVGSYALWRFWKYWRMALTIANLSRLSVVYKVMDGVVNTTGSVHRMFIFMGGNGGGRPRPSSPYYVSLLHHTSKDDMGLAYKFDKVQVDSHYMSTLVNLVQTGSVQYDVQRMNDGLIKSIMTVHGAKHVEYHLIKLTPFKLIFCAVVSENAEYPFDRNSVRLDIDLAVQKLRQTI